jgi:hypothetical protein
MLVEVSRLLISGQEKPKLRIIQTGLIFFISLLALIAVPFASAQKLVDPPVAPIPAQILSAKRAFIANGGSSVLIADTISPNFPYDELYAKMRSWGRYELLSAPADADLVFEIRISRMFQLQLLVIDPKTHTTLWTMYEQFNEAVEDSNKRKNLDAGIAALLTGLRKLTSPPAPTLAAPAKKEKQPMHIF